MNSALYHGWIAHRRLLPTRHTFRYRIGMLWLDLSEQEQLFALSGWASRRRFSAFSFNEHNYLPHLTRTGMPLIDAVRHTLKSLEPESAVHSTSSANSVPDGFNPATAHPVQHITRVCLLTQPRSWGLSFNPVSFYYCYDPHNTLRAILCEVSNTPWRERYHYLMRTETTGIHQFTVAKSFHVSPFLPRNVQHRMRFNLQTERLTVYMSDHQNHEKIFDAALSLQKSELNRSNLHRHIRQYPWMSAKTLFGIYWQALRMVVKSFKFFPHTQAQGNHAIAQPFSGTTHESPHNPSTPSNLPTSTS